jgi:hypothetical protein
MNSKYFIIIFILFLFVPLIKSQVVYEPIDNSVYNFLERQSLNGLINLHDEVKPFPRTLIANKLIEIDKKKDLLTGIESKDLDFYKNDFADEINLLIKRSTFDSTRTELFTFGKNDRFRVFNYKDSQFSVYVDPILGYSAERFQGSTMTHTWNGAIVYGYISTFLGFSLNFMDNQENGNYLDVTRNFTPLSGIDNVVPTYQGHNSQNTLQHDEVNATITASWSWGSFSFGKDFINVGSSLSPASQLILSSKAPSFPFIELRVSPVSWVRFTYIHGWLYSGILDSSTLHYSPVPDRQNYTQIPKFIATHFLSVDFSQNITLSIGESIIYSQNIEPLYLVPIMFFRLADHYLTKDSSNTGSNAQVFADGSIKVPSIKSKFYSTLFIDELSLTSVIENKNGASAVGYTFGAEIIDPVIENSSLVLEYTKISPFVYMNSNIAQTYTSYGYPLGNWIGNNGDITYLKYTQNILRGLTLDLWGDYIRKGSMPAPEQQYELPYPSTLFGLLKIQKEYGLEASYEIINDCWFKLFYSYSNISDQDLIRTPSYLLGTTSSIGLSISYGYNTLSR